MNITKKKTFQTDRVQIVRFPTTEIRDIWMRLMHNTILKDHGEIPISEVGGGGIKFPKMTVYLRDNEHLLEAFAKEYKMDAKIIEKAL